MIAVEKEMVIVVREDDEIKCLVLRDPKSRKQVLYSCAELDDDSIQQFFKLLSNTEGLVPPMRGTVLAKGGGGSSPKVIEEN